MSYHGNRLSRGQALQPQTRRAVMGNEAQIPFRVLIRAKNLPIANQTFVSKVAASCCFWCF